MASKQKQVRRRQAALALARPPMPDIAAWIERARSFWKRLKLLGAEFDSPPTFSVKKPRSTKSIDRISRSLRNPLPPPLLKFFETTDGLDFRYNLEALPSERRSLDKGLPPLGGGDPIGPLSELNAFQEDCLYMGNFMLEIDANDPNLVERGQEYLQAVPFLRDPAGDYLALDTRVQPDDPPVIYLCHEDDNRLVAQNFAAFLREWERLCYLCYHWPLDELCNREDGCLDSETPKAQRLRDIFTQPFRPCRIDPGWRTWHDCLIVQMAQEMYDQRDFKNLPILSDALIDAGCTNQEIIDHCRSKEPHVRGCWLVNLLLGKK